MGIISLTSTTKISNNRIDLLKLSPSEIKQYVAFRDSLLNNPNAYIRHFLPSWLRVVRRIRQQIWLISTAKNTERDLKVFYYTQHEILARKYNRQPTNDPEYWMMGERLADRILLQGIKWYSIEFLFKHEIEQLDLIFQKVLSTPDTPDNQHRFIWKWTSSERYQFLRAHKDILTAHLFKHLYNRCSTD